MIGKKRRMERLFVGPEKRCLMTPLDHGAWLGPQKGIDNPKDIVTKVLAGGANALLVTPGFLKQVESVITPDIGICLRVSITCGPSPEGKQEVLAATMETALKMDVDAVALSIFFGRGAEPEMQRTISNTIVIRFFKAFFHQIGTHSMKDIMQRKFDGTSCFTITT